MQDSLADSQDEMKQQLGDVQHDVRGVCALAVPLGLLPIMLMYLYTASDPASASPHLCKHAWLL